MKKSATILTIVLLATLLVAGCDLFSNLAFSDIAGEWEFPTLTQIDENPIHEAHLSILGDSADAVMLDISWYNGADSEDDSSNAFYMADGSMDGDTFTGTYTKSGPDDTQYNLTVEFSMVSGELKLECSGTGELDGITLTGGEIVAAE